MQVALRLVVLLSRVSEGRGDGWVTFTPNLSQRAEGQNGMRMGILIIGPHEEKKKKFLAKDGVV